MNPKDIESVSVLKDAAASAVYGAKRCVWCDFGDNEECEGW